MTQPLPPVFEGHLDDEAFEAFLRDLEACAAVREVRVRGSRPNPLNDESIALRDAAEQFRHGSARGMQIRYEHDGALWCDTLSRGSQGIRVVRIRQSMNQES